jgi:hypothetical protein
MPINDKGEFIRKRTVFTGTIFDTSRPASPASSPTSLTGQEKGLAVTSLVLGIISLLCTGFLTAPFAIGFGIAALKRINSSPSRYGGRGLAVSGLSLGVIVLLLSSLWLMPMLWNALPSLPARNQTNDVTQQNKGQTIGTMREVNTINLNMRSGPGTNYPVVDTFPKGSRIVSYGETRMVEGQLWTQASTPNGQIRGWVNRKHLSP